LVDAQAPEAAAVQVRQLASVDEETFQARRQHALAYVARYDWNTVVESYREEYRRALARTEGQAR
jgi:glycosyltransferase involved in cell wall biosynthesis